MNVSVMRIGYQALTLLVLMILFGCVATMDKDTAQTGAAGGVPCTDPRPQICPMHYLPVCGLLQDGSIKTYSNDCSACADPQVVSHRPGECP